MGFPKKVRIVEVGPRDGFQNVKTWIETADKLKVIRMLIGAGVDLMEATSFVSPKAVPQMQDAEQIIAGMRNDGCIDRVYALVPQKKGADFAVQAGARKLTVVISASEAHNMSNIRKTPAQSIEELSLIRESYPDISIKLSLATTFGCPFKGETTLEELYFVIDGAFGLGVRDICLCDTIGVANPPQVERVLSALRTRYTGIEWSIHLHDTRGLAAINTYVAMQAGIDRFETAVAGLGGCPFAPGATGNMATEDLVYLLGELGISCNVDIDRVIAAADFITERIGCGGSRNINAVTVKKIYPAKQ